MRAYLSLIKFSHTVFALPFALVGYVIGLHQPGVEFSGLVLVLVLLCMVFARSAAMAFNRYIDRDVDALNERTMRREVPAGVVSPKNALGFTMVNAILFIGCTWFINPLCFMLSPVALAVILGYSYTKRFTAFSHFVLGLGLALAPVGAYLAVTGEFGVVPVLIGFVVLLWVSGFDIIYAMQDEEFDVSHSLHSIPVMLGSERALSLSTITHFVCAVVCIWAVYLMSVDFETLGWITWTGAAVFLAALYYQHRIVSPRDLSRVNLAFFTTNGMASIVFGSLVILDFFV